MNIHVYSRSKVRKNFLFVCSKFYANELKLQKSKYSVHIVCKRGLRKHEGKLGVTVYKGKEIFVVLDSHLVNGKLFSVLAHEMVHVKQIALGQYKHNFSEAGELQQYWCGEQIKKDYFDCPWEAEAYRRETILVDRLLEEPWKVRSSEK